MLSIKYNKENSGGLGDRLIGLVNVINFSKLLLDTDKINIIWDYKNIDMYFENKNTKIIYDKENHINMINDYNHNKYENILKTNLNIFETNANNVVFSNMNTSIFLYKNIKFQNRNYNNDIIDIFNNLYIEYLKPTPYLINFINSYLNKFSKYPLIGCQIRTGDTEFWNNFQNKTQNREYHKNYIALNENKIENVILNIKQNLDKEYTNYYVYGTSDNSLTYKYFNEIFKEKFICIDEKTFHLDVNENHTNDDLLKIFSEHYILSQKMSKLYISDYSNFGCTIALTANHDNIYNLFLEKIKKDYICNSKKNLPK